MSKIKKIFVMVIMILLLLSFMIFIKIEQKSKETKSNGYQKIFAINNKKDIKSYLGYYDNSYYYINGYLLSDVYVVQGENENNITNKIIEEAKKNIKNDQKTFVLNNQKYYIENIFEALYMQNNSIAVFIDEVESLFNDIELEKINVSLKIDNIKINKNDEFKKVYFGNNGGAIYLKNVDIILEVNNNSINLKDLNDKNIYSDFIIDVIKEKYRELFEDDPLSNELIATLGLEYDSTYYLVIEKKRNNYDVDYYIYLEEQNEFKNRLGL